MEIIETRVLTDADYWSNYPRKLILMKLDIGCYEDHPTNQLDGFTERLTALIPSLGRHRYLGGEEGSFITQMLEGTPLGHVVEHVALELQALAGMDTGFGRTKPTGQRSVYHVVFSYLLENAGIYAAKAAVLLVRAVAEGKPYPLHTVLNALKKILYDDGFVPRTQTNATGVERKIPA
jgi:cyanophycin synthetase